MSAAAPSGLRPAQEKILAYRGGKMGISAVPGSGKTWTLSRLAARIIAGGELDDDQEVLVVTLVNSSVDNFYQRVSKFITSQGLLPNLGYRVRTLHSLAYEIVQDRPGLVGLAENFTIIDERDSGEIFESAVTAWLNSHPYDLDEYLDPALDDRGRDIARTNPDRFPKVIQSVAANIIQQAKDLRLSPERLRAQLDALPVPLPLAEMGAAIYSDYQRSLAYRGAVDFTDLIRLALQVLESEPDYLARKRHHWPYILEDEAQDSSQLQEQILSLLAGPDGNWVRVGDPNQAIYETFTTANPKFLRQFIQRPDVSAQSLPNSGRSSLSIINLANHLVEWTMNDHPLEAARDALQAPPFIEPTPPGDPQPNPSDDPRQVLLIERKFTPDDEIEAVADSVQRWLAEHPDETVAVLAPRSERAEKLADELRRRKTPLVESLLRNTMGTRATSGSLSLVLGYLAHPTSVDKLSKAYRVWRRVDRYDDSARAQVDRIVSQLRRMARVEDYLWPDPGQDWLDHLAMSEDAESMLEPLTAFRSLVRRWQAAVLLPVDQLVLTLAQDLFTDPTELALAHKLALILRQASQEHPAWRLPELSVELEAIAKNRRKLVGFSEDDTGFDPDKYKGKVVVGTIHKAKGLEWDRVYLMSANNYDFPSGNLYDRYISERWFIRGKLNLEAEGHSQLEAALSSDPYAWYREGEATQQARLDYIRERLRLFYVGITRARRELVVTWNSGRGMEPSTASIPFVVLQSFWDEHLKEISQS